MRTTLLYGLAAIVTVSVWVFAARSISILLDRIQTRQLTSQPVTQFRLDGGHTLEFAGVRHSILNAQYLPSELSIKLAANNRFAFTYKGAHFSGGPDPGDTLTYTTEQSYMSWPTPFAMNFMTGYAYSWERHLYCRLAWIKRSGATMHIVWRYEQGFHNIDGWRPEKIESGMAGFQSATITEATDFNSAAHAYLKRTKGWATASYELEDRGPAPDATGEIIAAIHHDDQTAKAPGPGLSVQLLLDYKSRQVAREIDFQ